MPKIPAISDKLSFRFNSKVEQLLFEAFTKVGSQYLGEFMLTPNPAMVSVTSKGKLYGKEPDFLLISKGRLAVLQLNSDKYHESFSQDYLSGYAYHVNGLPVLSFPVKLMNDKGANFLVKVICENFLQLYEWADQPAIQRKAAFIANGDIPAS